MQVQHEIRKKSFFYHGQGNECPCGMGIVPPSSLVQQFPWKGVEATPYPFGVLPPLGALVAQSVGLCTCHPLGELAVGCRSGRAPNPLVALEVVFGVNGLLIPVVSEDRSILEVELGAEAQSLCSDHSCLQCLPTRQPPRLQATLCRARLAQQTDSALYASRDVVYLPQ